MQGRSDWNLRSGQADVKPYEIKIYRCVCSSEIQVSHQEKVVDFKQWWRMEMHSSLLV
jgi:hypothetical protein